MDRTQLVEVKKGQEGTGLLLENDGYMSLEMPENKILKESIDSFKEGLANDLPRPFIVSAVFQKYGIENANGRVYPEAVLKSEVERYQKNIQERRAYGECYKPDVLCLCEDGWKPLFEVKTGDKVLSLNTDTNEIEIANVINKIEREHDGDMVHIKGRLIDDLVTSGHKFPVYKRDKTFDSFYTAEKLYKKEVHDMRHKSLLKTGIWNKEGNKTFILKGVENPSEHLLIVHPDCKNDIEIQMSSFMKFMGIYLSEGDFSKKSNAVRIYQKKENVCVLIDEMLNELPFKHSVISCSDGKKVYTIYDPRLHDYVSKLGNCYTKYIPIELKQESIDNLRIFYDWFVLGDGRIRGDQRPNINGRTLTDDVFSSSKQLALDLNEIQLKIGYNGVYHVEARDNDRFIEGRLIEGKNCKPLHFSFRSLSSNVYLDERFLQISKEYYKGEVQCIELDKNHTWYVMSNGKCHWTGNCNHPESSAIDAERICMNIIELHWVNHTLVGKIELPITEGFRRYGICSNLADTVAQWLVSGLKIGVSSRGMGDVKQELGRLYVSNYTLICWDVVCEPSTKSAWIEVDDEKLQPYIESVNNGNDDRKVIKEDKYSKFDKWLND